MTNNRHREGHPGAKTNGYWIYGTMSVLTIKQMKYLLPIGLGCTGMHSGENDNYYNFFRNNL
ncbi:hypothetical protein I79_006185 [Cricetulus griseus]|uniref:Uncharacterized protein n=1 Tax=Cricetulus griseus TaxID=10029 RepID=G3H760_CRIGR|nr:hypothetical protein I79_006185 [Cricetulus griseus]